ncbi:pectinesterase family protein [Abortiporus biennis]
MFTLFFTLFVAHAVLGFSPTFLPCQVQKPTGHSALEGCPKGTIFVSPTDKTANFTKVQDAISSLPATGQSIILIGEGQYHERVNVLNKAPITLLGQLRSTPTTQNLVQIWDNKFVENGMSDVDSAVFLIAPSLESSIVNSTFKEAATTANPDFKAYNIDFQNRAANYSISQALVMAISSSNASFYGCTFASYQDTWYTGHNANTFVTNSTIYGQTDYLFGYGTAWFQGITLANRACGGGIAAWKGTDQSTASGNKFGAYIADSRIIRSPDANATTVTTGKCFLGRPWNELATTVYLRTSMDSSINSAGFKAWGGNRTVIESTTFYAEYKTTGSGADNSVRVAQDHILTDAQAGQYTIQSVFGGTPSWIDFDYTF